MTDNKLRVLVLLLAVMLCGCDPQSDTDTPDDSPSVVRSTAPVIIPPPPGTFILPSATTATPSADIPEESPVVVPPPPRKVVVVSGGLGSDQTGDLAVALAARNQDAVVIRCPYWDGYKADIPAMVAANGGNDDNTYLFGHSFGGCTVILACQKLRRVKAVGAIDPVEYHWGDLVKPANVDTFVWWWRSNGFGPRDARIDGATPIVIKGGHNDLPHDPQLISQACDMVRGTK